MRNRPKALGCLAALLLAVALVVSAAPALAEAAEASSESAFSVLEGKTAGAVTGTPQDEVIRSKVSDTDVLYFSSASDMTLALESHKIDFFSLSSTNYASFVEQYPDFAYIKEPMQVFESGAIFPKTSEADALREEFNAYLAKIEESGELDRLKDVWLNSSDFEDIEVPETGEKGVLTMATSTTLKPLSFMKDGKPVGYDIAVVAGFCRDAGYGLQIENVEFAGVLSGIASGKYDIAACMIAKTEERMKSVNFSDSYFLNEIVAFVRADEYDSSELVTADDLSPALVSAEQISSVDNSLMGKIRRTIVEENRWQQILSGLAVTLAITIGGFALANVLGALFCAASLSKSKVLRALATAYSALMQGLPIVVILMILYYVVFGRSKVNNVVVSAAGFGLVFGAYLAQLFKGGIEGVETGQREAALASGLTERQAFLGIVLPQVVRSILPGYFSNLISLLKGTSIVGYIAVLDLTRAGDIIRSNTYEAFVPLFAVALIYLAIAGLLLLVLQLVQRRLDSRRRPARLAGTPTKGGLA